MKKLLLLSLCCPFLLSGMQSPGRNPAAIQEMEKINEKCILLLSLLEVENAAHKNFAGAVEELATCATRTPDPFCEFWTKYRTELLAKCKTEVAFAKIKLTQAIAERKGEHTKQKEYLHRAHFCKVQLKQFDAESNVLCTPKKPKDILFGFSTK
jgi:hypothetical protein